MTVPRGQRDYSTVRLSRHCARAVHRALCRRAGRRRGRVPRRPARTRRLGRNPQNGAIAVLGLYRNQVLVAIVQRATCMTVLTWNQFLPRLAEFGRGKLPRKWGRVLRRLAED